MPGSARSSSMTSTSSQVRKPIAASAAGRAQDPAFDAQRVGDRLAPGLIRIDDQHGRRCELMSPYSTRPAWPVPRGHPIRCGWRRALGGGRCARPDLALTPRYSTGTGPRIFARRANTLAYLVRSSRRRGPADRALGSREGTQGDAPAGPAPAVLLGPALRAWAPARPGQAAGSRGTRTPSRRWPIRPPPSSRCHRSSADSTRISRGETFPRGPGLRSHRDWRRNGRLRGGHSRRATRADDGRRGAGERSAARA